MNRFVSEKSEVSCADGENKACVSYHPFALLFAACIYVCALFDVTGEGPVSTVSLIFVLGSCAAAVLGAIYLKPFLRIKVGIAELSVFTLMAAMFFLGAVYSENTVFYLSVFAILLIVIAALWLLYQRKLTAQRAVMLIFAAGFVLRVAYILYTAVYERQHDVWYFANDTYDIGHAGYIEFYYENMKLPDFDPRTMWQYYHPPLHHIISALWMHINTFLGFSYARTVENIQILTLFYSSSCMIIVYKIMRQLELSGLPVIIACVITAFHPTFIIMSGSVNNDMLSVVLSFGAVLAVIRWYKKPTYGRIHILALCIGLAMMAKLSAALVAPPVAIVFLVKFIKEKGSRFLLFRQFVAFGVVCVPLGLWWQVYNFVRFGMPITYVPMLSQNSDQYIGNYSVWQRLFSFSGQLDPIYVAWNPERNGADYCEFNVFTALMKTAVFGEFAHFYMSPETVQTASKEMLTVFGAGNILCNVLFFAHLGVVLTAVAGVVLSFFDKKCPFDMTVRVFFGAVAAVVLGSYINFCFNYPHTCTMNIRYAVLLILVFAVYGGYMTDKAISIKRSLNERSGVRTAGNILYWWILSTSVVFALSSAAVYTLLGYTFQ